jgi:hypothetical protein
MGRKGLLSILLLALGLPMSAGCVVPQPRGLGQYRLVQEPASRTWYHLYLPVDYVRNNGQHPDLNQKRWPLVMTFHGMKPYDNALPQEREWEQEADNYGYIVCAPQLETSNSFMEYPLTKEHGYVLADKRNVIAVMDHVVATTLADPKRVLSTSWSCGGYLAHYFPNRFPDRFSCIATRLSNFSSELMLEETVPQYRDKIPVALFIGDGDFPACKWESEEAVAWYMSRKFRVVRGKIIDRMGHQRIPQTAAAFFAEQLGIKPLRPVEAAQTLAAVQMIDYHPPQDLIAKMSPPAVYALRPSAVAKADSRRAVRPTGAPPAGPAPASAQPSKKPSSTYMAMNAGTRYPVDQTPAYDPTPQRPDPAARETQAGPPGGTAPANKEKSPSVPPSGAEAIRVAQAGGGRPANWLEPVRTPSPSSESRVDAGAAGKPSGPGGSDRPADRNEPGKSNGAQPSGEKKSEGLPPARAASADTGAKETSPARPPPRQFSPKDAGSRHYEVPAASRETTPRAPEPSKGPQAIPVKEVKDVQPLPVATVDASASPAASGRRSSSGHAPKSDAPPVRSKPVVIRLNGPAIGRAPHWIGYSVDLPSSVVQGADFLWMDNGVWIGDEARGVKILETPGRHEITVLMVSRGNEEYRGSATVQVLDAFPVGRGSNVE